MGLFFKVLIHIFSSSFKFTEKLHREQSTESFQIPLISLHSFSLLLTSCVSVVQLLRSMNLYLYLLLINICGLHQGSFFELYHLQSSILSNLLFSIYSKHQGHQQTSYIIQQLVSSEPYFNNLKCSMLLFISFFKRFCMN